MITKKESARSAMRKRLDGVVRQLERMSVGTYHPSAELAEVVDMLERLAVVLSYLFDASEGSASRAELLCGFCGQAAAAHVLPRSGKLSCSECISMAEHGRDCGADCRRIQNRVQLRLMGGSGLEVLPDTREQKSKACGVCGRKRALGELFLRSNGGLVCWKCYNGARPEVLPDTPAQVKRARQLGTEASDTSEAAPAAEATALDVLRRVLPVLVDCYEDATGSGLLHRIVSVHAEACKVLGKESML